MEGRDIRPHHLFFYLFPFRTRFFSDFSLDTLFHLGGGFLGKSKGKNLGRTASRLFYEPDIAVYEHMRLSRAGSGGDAETYVVAECLLLHLCKHHSSLPNFRETTALPLEPSAVPSPTRSSGPPSDPPPSQPASGAPLLYKPVFSLCSKRRNSETLHTSEKIQ